MTHSNIKARDTSGRSQADITSALHNARLRSNAAGVRFTRIREHVYRALLQSSRPLGAYDILETIDGVGAQKPPTVYRALDWLMEMGLAHRIATLSKFVAAPIDEPAQPVAYLLCRECEQAETVDASPLTASLDLAVQDTGFQNENTVIEITGLCEDHDRILPG